MTYQDCSQELAQWLRLERTPGVGPDAARKLLTAFGLPENIFAASLPELQAVVSDRIARALLAPLTEETKALIERTQEWAAQAGNHVLTLAEAAYPRALLDIADPPILLYAKGRVDLLAMSSIAVVGSRNATAQGVSNAGKFSEALSQAGLTIVSGMALGIDTAAHQGALRGSGSTVAVIGTGADIVYPARNHSLAHQIAESGCIISEYMLGTPAIPSNFPRRNRIISGLSKGVLVIEAAAQSGSLITARLAGEQGRDVFAIPGSIHSPLSKGCHLLIKQGAKLVDSAQDILDEINHRASMPAPAVTQAIPDSPILAAMGFDPVDLDTLAQRCGFDIASLHAELLTLELDGAVETLPGGTVRRLATT
jgi:DNA processing protein